MFYTIIDAFKLILVKTHRRTQTLLLLLLPIGLALAACGQEQAPVTQANMMVELAFNATRAYADPFNQVTLDVIFSEPKGAELRVPAFWDGSNVWKARYASPMIGRHRFRTECSEAQDNGLQGITGSVEVQPYTGSNPLYLHGPLKVAPNGRHFEHRDHTPFFWLGDTWWMGLCHRLRWPEELRALAADRKQKGFNVIQIVAGLYPDMPPFDPRGANETGFPWETNYTRIRPEYFDAADQRLGYLVDQGMTPCIVGAWGYFIPWMGVEKMKAHWRYLIARYGAWPVVWCAAGEANLPYYLAPHFPYDDRNQVHDWTAVMKYIRATDPFHRLLTVHPTAINRLTARHATDDPNLLDFDMLQTSHGERQAVPGTIKAVRESFAAFPRMPVIDGEASYEMLNDSLPTEWTRRMFWLCMMNGAAGHTYGANGIWQCNRPGQPHGPSPGGGSGYGKIPWNEAMNLPGSRQLGLGKAFLQQFPWYRFEPHPEWAVAKPKALLALDGCRWIWFPEGNPAKDAPAAKRFFRRSFVLPAGKVVARASLRVCADDWFAAGLNGRPVGTGDDWRYGKQFDGLSPLLKPGTNILTITAENKPTALPANPAGLLARLEVEFGGGETLRLTSDAAWCSARVQVPDWESPGLDEQVCSKAQVIGNYGDGPWGRMQEPSVSCEPQAAGIADQIRVIYVQEDQQVEVRHLTAQATYRVSRFDPVRGETTALGTVRPDGQGTWRWVPPAGTNQDWLLVLENTTGGF